VHDPEGSHYENPDEAKLNGLGFSRKKMKLLQLALEKQNYNLAAHILVYGLIKAKVKRQNMINPKHQILNSKQIQSTNNQNSK